MGSLDRLPSQRGPVKLPHKIASRQKCGIPASPLVRERSQLQLKYRSHLNQCVAFTDAHGESGLTAR
jgi:hypothetical protein